MEAYSKQAKTINEQISLIQSYGITINNAAKAREHLSDIGYYRLGFYSFPFEISYPHKGKLRNHIVKPGTTLEDIVALYYYDLDLRSLLYRYLSRIEVSIRSTMINELSLKYRTNPLWFVSPAVVKPNFIASFDKEVYSHIRNKPAIKLHHRKYYGPYAPAWKTMEYMTMGNLEVLYDNLIKDSDKRLISIRYNEPAISSFKTYLSAIREVRNACAHGNVLYGLRLSNGIISGKASHSFTPGENQNLNGALKVIIYMLKQISVNRANDLNRDLVRMTKRLYSKVPSIRPVIEESTGIITDDSKQRLSIIEIIRNIFVNLSKITTFAP